MCYHFGDSVENPVISEVRSHGIKVKRRGHAGMEKESSPASLLFEAESVHLEGESPP